MAERASVALSTPIRARGFPEVDGRTLGELVQALHPEKIVLFGSHARGTVTSDSDVDLLILPGACWD